MKFGKGTRAAAAVLLTTAALGTTTVVGVLTTGCNGHFGNMISDSQEIDMGRQAAQDVERKNRVDHDPAINERMQRIAARIFPQAKQDRDVNYTVKVIDSKAVNAFALPGGPIYFYKGLIDLAQSDDEIAAVLAHESTHIVRRHAAKQISDANAKGLIASLLTEGKSSALQTLASIGLQLDQLHYSRADEDEADDNGFRYLTQAGYNPNAMADFFKRMQAKEKSGGGPEWLSDHPATQKRIDVSERRAAEYKREHPGP